MRKIPNRSVRRVLIYALEILKPVREMLNSDVAETKVATRGRLTPNGYVAARLGQPEGIQRNEPASALLPIEFMEETVRKKLILAAVVAIAGTAAVGV